MKRVFALGIMLLAFQSPASAAIIASLSGDFTTTSFPVGWQYMRNTGSIDTSPGYTPLLWDDVRGLYSFDGMTMPNPGPPLDYTLLAAGSAHPGSGTAQGSSFDRYLVLAYTIQPGEAGAIQLIDGSVRGLDDSGPSNGWDVLTFVGGSQVGSQLVFPWSPMSTAFSRSIGPMSVGETVYVALGPNGNHLYDSVAFDFTLTSEPIEPSPVPEPASTALAISIAVAAGSRRRRAALRADRDA